MKHKVEVDVAGHKIPVEVEIDINEIIHAMPMDKVVKLLGKGWSFGTEKDIGNISKLEGIKDVDKSMVLVDNHYAAMICRGKIDHKNTLNTYDMNYIDIAKMMGANTITLVRKEFPALFELKDNWIMIVAPRVDTSGD